MKVWPLTDRIGTRSRRRAFVVLLYGGITIYAFTATILRAPIRFSDGVLDVAFGASIAAVAAAAIGFFGLFRLLPLHAVTNAWDSDLDERTASRRNVALALAFRVFAIVCTLEAAAWSLRSVVLSMGRGPRAEVASGVDLASPFIYLDAAMAMTLPLAILAWMEPDPPPDDEP